MLLISCGTSNYVKVKYLEPLPAFPVFPKLSNTFYAECPISDLDNLLKREIELTGWIKKIKFLLSELEQGKKIHVSIPAFPAIPKLSDEFFIKVNKVDMDMLLSREWEVTSWKDKALKRVDLMK